MTGVEPKANAVFQDILSLWPTPHSSPPAPFFAPSVSNKLLTGNINVQ